MIPSRPLKSSWPPEGTQRLASSLDGLRWGLIPSRAKDEKNAYKTINARVETVDAAASYRSAFKKRRRLIPVDGYYDGSALAPLEKSYVTDQIKTMDFRISIGCR
jgi:putative SOS response-associated peptidase YedK